MNGPPTPQVESCGKCGRKILIERVINGSDHTMGILVTCGPCVLKRVTIGAEIYGEERWKELVEELGE